MFLSMINRWLIETTSYLLSIDKRSCDVRDATRASSSRRHGGGATSAASSRLRDAIVYGY